MTAPIPEWRGTTVTTIDPIAGIVVGSVSADGIALVMDLKTGLSCRVGVEALTKVMTGGTP
jgi:hypothetical protein